MNAIQLKHDIEAAIQEQRDPVSVALEFLPRVEQALAVVDDPGDAANLKNQVEAVYKYFRKTIPQVLDDRQEAYLITEKGAWAYLLCVHRHGELWNAVEPKAPAGAAGHKDKRGNLYVSFEDAGFVNRRDALTCARIAQLNIQDLEIYREAQQNRGRFVTPSGAENIWKQYFRQDEIDRIEQGIIESTPEGEYNTIVIDPPWPWIFEEKYDPGFWYGRMAKPYPEMSLDDIAAIELPAADDCILWLWTTHKFMRHSFDLLDRWGFEEKMILTWVKSRISTGRWLRSKSEFCIMAVKGSPKVDLTNQTTVLEGEAREHSRKPDSFYQMVESLCLGDRRLDYFAREQRPGWDCYGNEVDKFGGD